MHLLQNALPHSHVEVAPRERRIRRVSALRADHQVEDKRPDPNHRSTRSNTVTTTRAVKTQRSGSQEGAGHRWFTESAAFAGRRSNFHGQDLEKQRRRDTWKNGARAQAFPGGLLCVLARCCGLLFTASGSTGALGHRTWDRSTTPEKMGWARGQSAPRAEPQNAGFCQ